MAASPPPQQGEAFGGAVVWQCPPGQRCPPRNARRSIPAVAEHQGPVEAPGVCSAKQLWPDSACVLLAMDMASRSRWAVKARRPVAERIPPSVDATPVLKKEVRFSAS